MFWEMLYETSEASLWSARALALQLDTSFVEAKALAYLPLFLWLIHIHTPYPLRE
jgi:hypothetical protein